MEKQLTNQGTNKIKVHFIDKLRDQEEIKSTMWTKEVTRAFLAKMYHDQKVVGALKGIAIVEV